MSNLLIKPQSGNKTYHSLTSEQAGWTYLNFEAKVLEEKEQFSANTGDYEYCIVLLSGNFKVEAAGQTWETRNGRKDVFSGIGHAMYLSRNTAFTLTAQSAGTDIAICKVATDEDHPPRMKRPEEAAIEYRGGDNANRQINSLLEPGFDCHKIVCVEVYTPSGNWSSFPAHKHDERKVSEDGTLLEANLEEIYFYKIDKPQGYAIQQVYTDDRSLDEIVRVKNNEAVLVPKGYHPVVAGHGYHVYYLNFLAGSDQSLANTSDPDHDWIYGTWAGSDPRLPIVTAEMNGF
ncbi:5-deoxy-glucuronate isomerase [Dyadobacter sediminis]|uniref:5-deoxy-glucuronate isomerase n=1 Tax=Dyadobacter sediminis TaxID=1493691 RepID=A0A5R9KJU0_9BACT|nr:5-deoxy-glucuronate isomerase [Dyadobacter sediminis]TLU96487.1 5-deoxy-glucuronate isomerase [Dyadobacter sediminis]GGB82628.1 5-deoxy-glucuronate isomerase [Dyadobacter sediminis]